MDKDCYGDTVSDSKEESLAKAMAIMLDDIEKQKKNRVIIRPKVSLAKGLVPLILFLVSYLAWVVCSGSLSDMVKIDRFWLILAVTVLYFLIAVFFLKKFLVWLILLYQKYAPEKIRRVCYFEPSCSEYMRLSILKYGVFRGVYKGILRLGRCHFPNGGVDFP